MNLSRSLFGALCLPLFVACGNGPTSTPSPDMAITPMNNPDLTNTAPQSLSGTISSTMTLSGPIIITDDLTIAAGVTVTLKPGTLVLVAAGKIIKVEGTLTGQGTAAQPIIFQAQSDAVPGAWRSLTAMNGGTVNLTYVEIHNATTAFNAASGSAYALDRLTVDTSSFMLMLGSKGTISHSKLHALGQAQTSDPVVINDSSPQISDTLIDKGQAGVDMVQVNGTTSGALFDHLEVTGAHCAFHFNQGTKVTISNSYIHDNVYALMVESSTSTMVTTSNLINNSVNLGTCVGGGSCTASGVFFGTVAPYDGSCATQTNTAPAPGILSNVGPRF